MTKTFDYRSFYNDLNKARRNRGIAWNKVATRAGMAPSGLHTFVQHFENPESPFKRLSTENLIRLLVWLGKTDLAPYLMDKEDA